MTVAGSIMLLQYLHEIYFIHFTKHNSLLNLIMAEPKTISLRNVFGSYVLAGLSHYITEVFCVPLFVYRYNSQDLIRVHIKEKIPQVKRGDQFLKLLKGFIRIKAQTMTFGEFHTLGRNFALFYTLKYSNYFQSTYVFLSNWLMGGLAGTIHLFVTQPYHNLKNPIHLSWQPLRLQTYKKPQQNLTKFLKQKIKTEGIYSFYRGLSKKLLVSFSYSSGYFGFYATAKEISDRKFTNKKSKNVKLLVNLLTAYATTYIALSIQFPFTKIFRETGETSIREIIKNIILTKNGLQLLTDGFNSRFISYNAMLGSITLFLYEYFAQAWRNQQILI